MQTRLIIIGGGYLQLPLVKIAKEMGLYSIVFDMADDAPGMQMAHQRIIMSTRDIEGCVREARKLNKFSKIHGVVTAGTDASRAVSAIASALELLGIRYVDAEACSNKVLMRRRLQKFGLPIPKFCSVFSLKEAREAMDLLNFPLVLKPAENMGARGVIKIEKRQDIYTSFRHTKKYSSTGEMIIEEYMSGPELSLDALAWDDKIQITGIADRIIAHEPYFIELGHNMPSCVDTKILKEASSLFKKGMQALGIHTGGAKADLKITSDGVKIGEIAARLSGGFMSSHTYPLSTGVNLHKAAIEIALGRNPKETLKIEKYKVAIERSILCNPGKILKISGIDKMSEVKNIKHIHIWRKENEIMPFVTSNIDKLGHIIAVGKDLETAKLAIDKALPYLDLQIDESYGVDWDLVNEKARLSFGNQTCWVCKTCDGANCASGVPGMGGVGNTGNMNSFHDNSVALSEIHIVPRYIRESVKVDTSWEFLGRKLEYPIMAAPMTGTTVNMNSAIDEYDFSHTLLSVCQNSGSLAWVGDGASHDKYLTILKALKAVSGFGILICKPRSEISALEARFALAEKLGVLAVGIDIDAISFPTLIQKKQATKARNANELRKIRSLTKLPFILKGIMSPQDAELALEAGVDVVVVSNHGGRILNQMPGTARVLEGIAKAINGRVPVLVDGGIRSGIDAFKMLALGADAVLVGRPIAIATVGGGDVAVKNLFTYYATDLSKTMNLCGTETCASITNEYILHKANLKASSHKKYERFS